MLYICKFKEKTIFKVGNTIETRKERNTEKSKAFIIVRFKQGCEIFHVQT